MHLLPDRLLFPVLHNVLHVFIVRAMAHRLAPLGHVTFPDQLGGRQRLIDGLVGVLRSVAASHLQSKGLVLLLVAGREVDEAAAIEALGLQEERRSVRCLAGLFVHELRLVFLLALLEYSVESADDLHLLGGLLHRVGDQIDFEPVNQFRCPKLVITAYLLLFRDIFLHSVVIGDGFDVFRLALYV